LISTSKPDSITNLEYPGKWGFIFERAVVAWWIGLYQESKDLFNDLNNNHKLDQIHKNAVIKNLNSL